MCDKALSICKAQKWSTNKYFEFVRLITNPKRQYKLSVPQKEILTEAILECPAEYKSLVFLYLIHKNGSQGKIPHTLEGIIEKIIDSINIVLQEQYNLPSISRLEKAEDFKSFLFLHCNIYSFNEKVILCRYLMALLSDENKKNINFYDTILEFLSGLPINDSQSTNIFQQKTRIVIEFLQKNNPKKIEVLNLAIFNKSNLEFQKELEQSKKTIEKLRYELNKFQNLYDQELEKNQKLESNLCQVNTELNEERVLYNQLKSSSQMKISQERNATIREITSVIRHEIKKLDTCFRSKNIENFIEKQEIGLTILEKIKKQLSMEE